MLSQDGAAELVSSGQTFAIVATTLILVLGGLLWVAIKSSKSSV